MPPTSPLPAAVATDSIEIDAQIREQAARENVLVVLRASLTTPFTGAIAATLVLLMMSYDPRAGRLVGSAPAWLWFAVMNLLLAVSGLYVWWVLRSGAASSNPRRAALVYGLLGVPVSSTWAASMLIFIPSASPALDTVLTTAIALVLCAGTASLATHGFMARCFALPLAAVAAWTFGRLGDPANMALGGGFVILAIHLLGAARATEKASLTGFQLTLLNERLRRRADEERHAAEAARAEAERLQALADEAREAAVRSDQGKTRFIAATSHDLRQPLHALVQYVADLRAAPVDPAVDAKLQRVDDAVSVLGDLLDAALDFSRVAAGDLQAHIQPVDLARLLASIEGQLVPAASAKGLHLVVEASDGWVRSDAALLARVIGNIAQNAIRYTPSGRVVIRSHRRGKICRILVADTGVGIAPAFRSTIYDEYFQIGNPERDRRKGLGLGLSIARDLGQRLGLRIRLSSKQGRGTVFAIEVPCADAVGTGPPPTATPGRDLVRGTLVLLIEDDPMAREGLAGTLRRFGCRVLEAASASEAEHLVKASEFPPQLILSDVRLADGVDGHAAAVRLADRLANDLGPEFRAPVILVSGDTQLPQVAAPADRVWARLKKPVAPAALHRCMNEALESALEPARDGDLPDR